MRYGFIKPKLDNTQFVLGALGQSLPTVVVRPDGQWDDFLPKDEFQRNEFFDTYNCTGYATQNAIEILLKAKYGEDHDFGERCLGVWAGTYPPGNDPHIVIEAARKKGLVPDTMLPFTSSIKSADEYYDLDGFASVLDSAGKLFLTRYDVGHEWIFNKELPSEEQRARMIEALQYSPLGVAVYAWAKRGEVYVRKGEDTHWTVIYGYYPNGDWKCYDSYDSSKKRLDKDFGFTYIKRYHVEKKTELQKRGSLFSLILDFLKRLFSSDYRIFGATRSSGWSGVRKTHIKQYPKCAVCGVTKKLSVHHKKPFHMHPELELDPKNLVTLCESAGMQCHITFGHLGDYKCVNNSVDKDIKIWNDKVNKR